ncbi:MAG: UDP-D-galactose:(glucosyl)lipopolysaccharide-1,6-D-galactosyltransferase [Methanosaeta sp. PtaU1.Bin055]|nr:MAG: UDP-D-galactose:(glucosyl)lipopolysaccharide-1,6-D-galactosyltransferase [Methanosaeta sp. PtaU1.Bin055]
MGAIAMKIAYVHDVIYPYVKGGAERRVWEVSRRLAGRGHEVHIFGMKHWQGDDLVERDGVFLHGVCPPGSLYVGGRRSISAAVRFSARLLPKLRGDFDVIDAQQFPYLPCFSAKLQSLRRGAPLVITWHEVWGDYWREYLGKMAPLGILVERGALRLPERIIPVSERVRADLLGMGVGADRMEVVKNGVDLDRIGSVGAEETLYDVIYVGRLSAHKRVDLLIEAVGLLREAIPEIRCGIVGDGPEMAAHRRLVRDRGLEENVDLLGFLEDEDDLIAKMKAARIFVLPSTREGFGISVLEANACGLPAVVVDSEKSAAADLIREGKNGVLCRPSASSIASKVEGLLAGGGYKRMAGPSKEIAKGYDWSIIVGRLEGAYEEL